MSLIFDEAPEKTHRVGLTESNNLTEPFAALQYLLWD